MEEFVMKFRISIGICTIAILAACAGVPNSIGGATNPFIQELPDGVLAIAAPYQDLNAVKIEPSDGCYVYRHVGAVETTFLPLRSINGRPICSRPAQPIQTN